MNELDFLKGLGGFGTAIGVLVILWRIGLIQFGKNGKNGNGYSLSPTAIKEDILNTIETNHFHVTNEAIGEIAREFRAFKDEVIKHHATELEILKAIQRHLEK